MLPTAVLAVVSPAAGILPEPPATTTFPGAFIPGIDARTIRRPLVNPEVAGRRAQTASRPPFSFLTFVLFINIVKQEKSERG